MPNGCTMPAQSWLQQSIIASQPFLAVLRRQRMHGMTISPLPAERRSDWEIDNSITLFTLTLVTNWFEKETPLIISPLHETDSIPERIMLYRQEDHYDAC